MVTEDVIRAQLTRTLEKTSFPTLGSKYEGKVRDCYTKDGKRTIVVTEEGETAVEPYADHLITLPRVPTLLQPLVATVPLQVFACEMATAKGYDVDQPRNLAKSVTVE